MFLSAEDSSHSQHPGAEEAPDGPGHFHEDSGLLLHCDFLRRPLQRGQRAMGFLWQQPERAADSFLIIVCLFAGGCVDLYGADGHISG